MANYDGFCFAGHGVSEVNGSYDPGATNGSVKENDISRQLRDRAIALVENRNIHSDEQNYVDNDLKGNTYAYKCGVSIHINAGGGTGVEAFVPCKEKYLSSDINLCKNIAMDLNIPSRGVKSRDYTSGITYNRTDGVSLNYNDYYKEIRDAWNQGISLTILEVGFIDTSDLSKIQNNIDKIARRIAEYLAENYKTTVKQATTPTKPPTTSTPNKTATYRVIVNGKQVGAYSVIDNALAKIKEQMSSGAKNIEIQKI